MFHDPPRSLLPGAKGSRLERLLLRIAPERAVGYRLGYPDYRARVTWYPSRSDVLRGVVCKRDQLCFTLRPFEVPTLPSKGTYQLEFVDARGRIVRRTDWTGHSGVHIKNEANIDRLAESSAGEDHWEDDGSWSSGDY